MNRCHSTRALSLAYSRASAASKPRARSGNGTKRATSAPTSQTTTGAPSTPTSLPSPKSGGSGRQRSEQVALALSGTKIEPGLLLQILLCFAASLARNMGPDAMKLSFYGVIDQFPQVDAAEWDRIWKAFANDWLRNRNPLAFF